MSENENEELDFSHVTFDKATYKEKESMLEKKDYIEKLAKELTLSIATVGIFEDHLSKAGVKGIKASKMLVRSLNQLTNGRKNLKKELKKLNKG